MVDKGNQMRYRESNFLTLPGDDGNLQHLVQQEKSTTDGHFHMYLCVSGGGEWRQETLGSMSPGSTKCEAGLGNDGLRRGLRQKSALRWYRSACEDDTRSSRHMEA